jgi:hypothetical protein
MSQPSRARPEQPRAGRVPFGSSHPSPAP